MKYAVVTFGCRVNQADSFALERQIRAVGGQASLPEDADLVIVNSCSVTATADQGTRQTIRRVARLNPTAKIVATGCYSTRDVEAVAALPGVIAVVANEKKDRLVRDVFEQAELALPTTANRFGEGDGACGAMIEPGEAGRTAYTLRVQTGCDESCAYCIIPSTRGGGRSVPLHRVLAEVEDARDAGYRELQLTGVHLGSYGRDLNPRSSLFGLLQALDRQDSNVVIRMSSLEPMDCTPEIIDLVTTSPRFAAHFHLPLQHASDTVLRRMRRPYTRREYEQVVGRIRQNAPDAAIGSDVVVGFPGETDAHAIENIRFLTQSPLTYLHVFPYSDRPGTEASKMKGKVHGQTIRDRARAVREVGSVLSQQFRVAQIGRIRPGLTLRQRAHTVVLTDNYLRVQVPVPPPENVRVHVRILTATDSPAGELVNESMISTL